MFIFIKEKMREYENRIQQRVKVEKNRNIYKIKRKLRPCTLFKNKTKWYKAGDIYIKKKCCRNKL